MMECWVECNQAEYAEVVLFKPFFHYSTLPIFLSLLLGTDFAGDLASLPVVAAGKRLIA
jgi:hypothetical protein